jgi:nucleoside-diphosphate-sugar epimerase
MPDRPLRCLVTGATGFLGRNVLASLQSRPDVAVVAACRTPEKLPRSFAGEVRAGDLLDASYRRAVCEEIDVVCHAGTWASMWAHDRDENERFYGPTCDLIEQAIRSGARRFLQTATVVMAPPPRDGKPLDDFAEPRHTGFWPHVDRLIDVDRFMRRNCNRGMQMVAMRLGHFVGAGNRLGLVPALLPRLRTRLVPWLNGGRSRLPLVADTDLGESFAAAATCPDLDNYESFNICGPDFPTTRSVLAFIAAEAQLPTPRYGVPYAAGYAFAWLMEKLHPILPGSSPFLTRSIVYLAEDWPCSISYATRKLGYVPRKDWRTAVRESLMELKGHGHPWLPLVHARTSNRGQSEISQ